jgi:outer membrane receptor protein involved in Fe transport
LHELSLILLYNHPSGFFARAEANWYHQGNHDYSAEPVLSPASSSKVLTIDTGLPGDSFWQLNVLAGYRFARNQCELSVGILNLNNQDYRLSPLDPYEELPRTRTFFARCRLSF